MRKSRRAQPAGVWAGIGTVCLSVCLSVTAENRSLGSHRSPLVLVLVLELAAVGDYSACRHGCLRPPPSELLRLLAVVVRHAVAAEANIRAPVVYQ